MCVVRQPGGLWWPARVRPSPRLQPARCLRSIQRLATELLNERLPRPPMLAPTNEWDLPLIYGCGFAAAEQRGISDLLASRSRGVAYVAGDWVVPPYVALTGAVADPCQPSPSSIPWQGTQTHPYKPMRVRARRGSPRLPLLVLAGIGRVPTTPFSGSRVRPRTIAWLSHEPMSDGQVKHLPTDAAERMKRRSDQRIARIRSPFARRARSVKRQKYPIRSSCTYANPSSSHLVEAPQAASSRIAAPWTMGRRRSLRCSCVGSLCNSSVISSSYSASESDCIVIALLWRLDRSR